MNNSHSTMKALSGLLPEELFSALQLEKKFRAKQIFKWIADGARDFSAMTNISLKEREELAGKAVLFSTVISQTLRDPDGTVKLQIACADGGAVETVLLTDRQGRKTACVSCQIGCPMGCAFCQTGHIGFSRNLDAGEIVEQFFHLEDTVGKLDNIVFMGMGEPMLNLPEIRKAIRILTHPEGRALSKRRITLSTSGLVSGIRDLADNGPDIRLAVSLTSANSRLRTQLMPVNKTNPLPELKEAIRYFSDKTGRRVTLEAALMRGVNTSEENAREMADFARGLNAHFNLIAWNPVETLPFQTPDKNEIHVFADYLEKLGLNATLRYKRGEKIGGACGQLGKSSMQSSVHETDDEDDFE
ncbi:23S rRNA (adenine(2503)-C(2))-methyltransferase RlmN [Teretinema zuelzerae]|nr:23S rRNA (adenine(2503)-C(2))-methyltransferase RlmN [Teretinema zuelzerae]